MDDRKPCPTWEDHEWEETWLGYYRCTKCPFEKTLSEITWMNSYRREEMEKRGVVLDDNKTKTAGVEKRCPSCGTELTDPTHCPNCGTEPFEKRRNDAQKEDGD